MTDRLGSNPSDNDRRRAKARRMAWLVAGIALAIYILFIYLNAIR
ncbi:hypothetical protein Nwat_3097 [Nitrosococcus watsonii C-113]|uniref:Uncharacterized protein n=1 Tax=Nitrosococcus watsoni (strain C-113) TaxID=105559 RepID=D8K4L3_NITWC|nr:hypothetical protein Nwat_3097 [Nitrosococcus watsonii C-113]